MKYYESMANMGCFSRSELSEALNLCDATVATLLQQYQKKGYIERVRCDLYAVISMETGDGFAGVPPDWEYGSRFARGA